MKMSQTLEQPVCNPGGWGVSICWCGGDLALATAKAQSPPPESAALCGVTTLRVIVILKDAVFPMSQAFC